MAVMRYLPLLLLVSLAVAFAWHLLDVRQPSASQGSARQDAMLGKPVPDLLLPALDADVAFSLRPLQGEPYLLNVFASWCAGCKLEHATLRRLAESQGLPLYGIAWKDNPDQTRAWLERMGNIYAAIGVDRKGEAAIELGLTGAPETYLVAADGTIAALHRGALSDAVVRERFLPVIEAMQEE